MVRPEDISLAQAVDAALARGDPPSAWPSTLVAEYSERRDLRDYREGRYILGVAAPIIVLSSAVEFVVVPSRAVELLLLRLATIVPLAVLGLALPRRFLALQKLVTGLCLIGFAFVLLHASTMVPPPSDAFMALGSVIILGMGLPVVPFTGWERGWFVAAYCAATAGALLWLRGDVIFAQAFLPILAVVAFAALVLAHRVGELQKRALLLSLQAELQLEQLEEHNAGLGVLARTDPLTGLANRRHLDETLAAWCAAPEMRGDPRPVAMLLVDIDHFKAFNDNYGHQAGDACLHQVAGALSQDLDPERAIAARLGGEEFLLVLMAEPGTPPDRAQAEASEWAETLRARVAALPLSARPDESTVRCTISVGVATGTSDSCDPDGLLARADAALYEAKAAGRDCVRIG